MERVPASEDITQTYNILIRKYEGKRPVTKPSDRKNNSVVSVQKRAIPTERPPLVNKVSANFVRIEGATWPVWRIPTAIFSVF
jgi:hypothetical protein